MTTFKQRLERLLQDVQVLSVQASNSGGEATWWIEAAGPVCLELSARGELTVTALIYVIEDPEREICWDAIADFNAHHLHDGGYRLFVENGKAIFVSTTPALARLETIGLGAFLEDFIARCGTCTCWYTEQVDGVDTAA